MSRLLQVVIIALIAVTLLEGFPTGAPAESSTGNDQAIFSITHS